MKQIKKVIIEYEDSSFKGYNRNAWREVMRIKFKELMKDKIFVDMIDHCKYLGIKRLE